VKIVLFFVACLICHSGYAQTQFEMNQAEEADYELKDAELNRAYKKLLSVLRKPKDKETLLKAQRAWITYRDAHCAMAESAYETASMRPQVLFACLREVTEQRIKELTALVDDRLQ
jgi:uncharacterized protein YecT (DUF1311 family)